MKTECISDCVKLNGKNYPCPISVTMDLVGGKWKAVILYYLKDEPKRYNELCKEMPCITEMTLSLQLKKLEKDGLISKKVYGKKPPLKAVYSLTNFGKTFIPVLELITEWGNQAVSKKGEFVNI